MQHVHSIRWRLSLSYAAIACLAALALGAVLLAILRDHYDAKERAYLRSNAEGIQNLVAGTMAKGASLDTLTPLLKNLAFVSKIRIRVLDPGGAVLSDSGVPDEPYTASLVYAVSDAGGGGAVGIRPGLFFSEGDLMIQGESFAVESGIDSPLPGDGEVQHSVITSEALPSAQASTLADGNLTLIDAFPRVPIISTFYGFGVGTAARQRDERLTDYDATARSDQVVQHGVYDSEGALLGTIIVSDGPAYGSAIVSSVARGWALAGVVAVVLAAAAGWFVSREITKPLLALADVTARMTTGDLAARANVARRDELGLLAASFNTMAARIQETVVTLKRFVADAAHELHTPLTALRTNLELAESGSNPAALRRACEQVIRLQTLTDDLLDLSRIEAGTAENHLERLDLGALVRSVSEVYASRAEQNDLDYTLNLAEDISPVMGRAAQLGRVVTNLLDNAVKFTPPGGAVCVSLDSAGTQARLCVQDTGIGIPPDDLPALFERFRRARNASGYPGSGLGLAVVRATVQAHGGTVRADSSDQGTTITVMLPLSGPPDS